MWSIDHMSDPITCFHGDLVIHIFQCVCNLATEGDKVFAIDGSIEITGQCSPNLGSCC